MVLVGVVTAGVSWFAAPQKVPPSLFPELTQDRVFLPDEETGERQRESKFTSDGFIKLCDRVFFQDGSTGFVNYRPDGTASQFATFYPAPEDTASQVGTSVDPFKCDLKLADSAIAQIEGEYAEDGRHLLWEKQYFVDGTLRRSGNRIDEEHYAVTEYHSDGIKLAGEFVFDGEGDSLSEKTFYPNGNPKLLVTKIPEQYTTETTRFAEDGKKVSYVKAVNLNIIWETYQDDGETLAHRFEQKPHGSQFSTSYHMYAWYYDEHGVLIHERKFDRYNMYVKVLDKEGNIVYAQHWRNKKADEEGMTYDHDQWLLDGVLFEGDIYSADRHVWFAKDEAKTVDRYIYDVEIAKGVTKTVLKKYHPDGSLASWRRPDPDNPGKTITTEYEPGESSESFDHSILDDKHLAVDYIVPPQIVPKTKMHGR